jgi:hypothetical protein
VLGVYTLKLVFPAGILAVGTMGTPALSNTMTFGTAIGLEAVLTFFLMSAVMGTAVAENAPKVGGFGIGLVLLMDILGWHIHRRRDEPGPGLARPSPAAPGSPSRSGGLVPSSARWWRWVLWKDSPAVDGKDDGEGWVPCELHPRRQFRRCCPIVARRRGSADGVAR